MLALHFLRWLYAEVLDQLQIAGSRSKLAFQSEKAFQDVVLEKDYEAEFEVNEA
jgi:hypothetical protein